MPPIDLVVLKVAAPCNLNCTYCYVYNARDQTFRNRPGMLDDEMARRVVERLKRYCDSRPNHRISICLHGGEPLLIGKERLRRLVALLRTEMGERLGSLSLQTNAVLVGRSWAELLRELRLSVSVSLDGPARIHDAERVDRRGRGTHARTVAGIRNLLQAGMRVCALCVVRPGESGADVYHYMRSIGLRDLDFLLPDISHDDWYGHYGHFPPTAVADFLIAAAEAWLTEDNPDVSIRFLADNRALSDVPPNRKFAGAGPRRRSAGVFPTGAHVAVLVSNTFQYGTTRQFSVLSVEAGAAVESFYDVERCATVALGNGAADEAPSQTTIETHALGNPALLHRHPRRFREMPRECPGRL